VNTPIPLAGTGRRVSRFLLDALSLWSWLLLSFLLVLASSPAHAVVFTSQLVTNLPPLAGLPNDSFPSVGAAMGGYFYFAATDGRNGTTGRELWRTDGTPGGTTLVKDIRLGNGDSSPSKIVASDTSVFFVATDGIHGQQLWKSDGTAAGTISISSLPTNAAITAIYPIGDGACYTVAYDNFLGPVVLFRTDGTANGTFALVGLGGTISTNSLPGHPDVSGTSIVFATLDYYDSYSGRVTNTLWSFSGTGPFYTTSRIITDTNWISDPHIVGTNCYFSDGGTNYFTVTDFGTVTNLYTQAYLWRSSLFGNPQVVDASPWGYGYAYTNQGRFQFPQSSFRDFVVTNGHLFYSTSYSKGSDGVVDPVMANGPWMAIGENGSPVNIDSPDFGFDQIIGNIGPILHDKNLSDGRRQPRRFGARPWAARFQA
jgi:ELWxxDGT repeat protein